MGSKIAKLLEKAQKDSFDLAQEYIAAGQSTLLDNLLKKKPELFKKYTTKGETLLFVAVKERNLTIAMKLKQNAKFDIEDKNFFGETVLMVATMNGNIAAVQWLLDEGANINCRDYQGFTPLMAASALDHKEILRELLKRDANASLRNQQGQTALHRAVFYGRISSVIYLSKVTNLKFYQRDKDGNTCFHLAAQKFHIRIIRYMCRTLVVEGVSPNQELTRENKKMETALSIITHEIEKVMKYVKSESDPVTIEDVRRYIDNKDEAPSIHGIGMRQNNHNTKKPMPQGHAKGNRHGNQTTANQHEVYDVMRASGTFGPQGTISNGQENGSESD